MAKHRYALKSKDLIFMSRVDQEKEKRLRM